MLIPASLSFPTPRLPDSPTPRLADFPTSHQFGLGFAVRSGAGCDVLPLLLEPGELELDELELDEPDDRESAGDGASRGRAVRPVLPAPTPGWYPEPFTMRPCPGTLVPDPGTTITGAPPKYG